MSKSRQAILKIISIKLEVETHKKYRQVLSKLFALLFILFLGYGTYNAIDRYTSASQFSEEAIFVDANLEELEYISDEESKYRYSYTVNGRIFQNEFIAPFMKYDNSDQIKIAYKKSAPEQSERADIIEKSNGIGSIFKTFGLLLVFGGLGFLVFYGFLTYGIVQPTEDYEDDEDDTQNLDMSELNSSTDSKHQGLEEAVNKTSP